MIKYLTTMKSTEQIHKVEVTRENETLVFYPDHNGKEKSGNKRSLAVNFFDTWQEAHDFLEAEKAEKAAKDNLIHALKVKKAFEIKRDALEIEMNQLKAEIEIEFKKDINYVNQPMH